MSDQRNAAPRVSRSAGDTLATPLLDTLGYAGTLNLGSERKIEMPRLVNCAKLGGERPALDAPPFPGPLGERIFEHVSAEGYALWQPHMTILINHYGLNPADPETRKMMRKEMEEFFFGADARMPEGWIPPEAAPSKGGEPPRRK